RIRLTIYSTFASSNKPSYFLFPLQQPQVVAARAVRALQPEMATSTQAAQTLVPSYPLRHDRPAYHIAPRQGWLNDPNGPLFYKGYYHMFYQHVPEGCTWSFGLVWAHAVSPDLVHWEHLPHAVVPTPGGLDSDGCFSGCATIDENGVPTIMYT
ncbi:hypothetical protein Agub_g8069, partial [Astrephomene gubernaculifera]